MRTRNFLALFFFFLTVLSGVFGQPAPNYPRGAIFDEAAYNSLPRRDSIAAGSYEGLPKSFSLKQYAPLPGDQTHYGTCVAWAVAYAARTISESIALNRLNQTETTQNAFSVAYVYKNIRPDDPYGIMGAQIYTALDMMRDSGVVKMSDTERIADFRSVDLLQYKGSQRYPIAGYVTLFTEDDKAKPALIIRMVKRSLTEGKPVIIGMNTPDSFLDAEYMWEPREDPEYFYGGHAICVVGYDDDKDAFEIMNSWGRKWGNGGFIWIPYKTFVDFVTEAYEIIDNISIYSGNISFSGSARIEVLGSSEAKPVPLAFGGGIYRTLETFTEGTMFRYTVGAGEDAYVYAFTASLSSIDNDFYAPVQIFPRTGISPLLNHGSIELSLPGDDKFFLLDADAGTEYLVVLYAKQALDMATVMRRFGSAQGDLLTRLGAAIGANLLDSLLDSLVYDETEAAFSAEPKDPRAVAALIVALEHR